MCTFENLYLIKSQAHIAVYIRGNPSRDCELEQLIKEVNIQKGSTAQEQLLASSNRDSLLLKFERTLKSPWHKKLSNLKILI